VSDEKMEIRLEIDLPAWGDISTNFLPKSPLRQAKTIVIIMMKMTIGDD
jgi:hypothetical protein